MARGTGGGLAWLPGGRQRGLAPITSAICMSTSLQDGLAPYRAGHAASCWGVCVQARLLHKARRRCDKPLLLKALLICLFLVHYNGDIVMAAQGRAECVCAQSLEPSVVPRQCVVSGAAEGDSLPRGTGKVGFGCDDVTVCAVC